MDNLIPTSSGSKSMMIMSISICLGAFVFFYNAVCLTQIAELLKLKNDLTKDELVRELSIATSCFNLGAFLSPILYRKYVNLFGEIKGLLLIDILGIVTILVELTTLRFEVLAACRLFLGFLLGISTAIIPVFITSISPLVNLGRNGSFNQLLMCLGVTIAYVMGYIIDSDDKTDEFKWRIFLGFPIIFLLLRILSLQFIYRFETLQRHIQKGDTQKLKQYCELVYGNNEEYTIQSIIKLKSFKKISQQNRPTWKIRFAIGIVLIISNQVNGQNSILFYAKQLFNQITHDNSAQTQLLMVFMSLVQLLGVMTSIQVVDKIGRKKMILNGQAFLIFCLFGIFLFNKILSKVLGGTAIQVSEIIFICFHLFVVNLTLGPCCIIYCTQILQDITWIIITLKGVGLLIALTTDYMIQYIGLGFMFLIYFGLSLIAHLFLRPRLKQTKGLTPSQIYSAFEKKSQSQQKRSLVSQNGFEETENRIK